MRKTRENSEGTAREHYDGLPFAGNPITQHDELLDYYFSHPTSSHSQPLGSLHGVADHDEERYL